MENQIILHTDYGLSEDVATNLLQGLQEVRDERAVFIEQYKLILQMDIEDPNTQKAATELLSKVRKNRTQGVEKWHKDKKLYFLNGGRFIDATKNSESELNQTMEKDLAEIKNYAEIQLERKRDGLRAVRTEQVKLYDDYVPFGLDLGSVSEEEWAKIFNGAKLQYEAQIAAEKKAEEERVEKERIASLHNKRKDALLSVWDFETVLDKENLGVVSEGEFNQALNDAKNAKEVYEKEQADIRAENDSLRKQAQDRQDKTNKRTASMQPYVVFIRDYNGMLEMDEDSFEKELSDVKKGAELHWEQERIKEEKTKAIENELRAKKEKEEREERERIAKEKADREEEERKAKFPIKDQMNNWVESFSLPDSSVDNRTAEDIKVKFLAFKNWAKKEIEKL